MSSVVLDQGRLKVVLVSPRNPLNIGAAARAMSNFGFFDLRLVNSYDVAYREARSAVNASAVMESAREFATVAEAVADCSLVVGTTALGHRELQHPLRRLEYGGRLIRKHAASENVALMFGSEKFGLSNDDMAFCHWLVRIPTREGHQSMNLGQAVAICLYELIRNPRAAAREPMPNQTRTRGTARTAFANAAHDVGGIGLHESHDAGFERSQTAPLGTPHEAIGARCRCMARHDSPDPLEGPPLSGNGMLNFQ